jgi:t-SNARE complex subunit (syntaxin)
MTEIKELTTVSMRGCKYSWDDVDKDAKDMNMNTSQFIQHLYILFKEKKGFMEKKFYDFTTLLLLIVVVLGVVILLLRV